jgi:hypothetical protein
MRDAILPTQIAWELNGAVPKVRAGQEGEGLLKMALAAELARQGDDIDIIGFAANGAD